MVQQGGQLSSWSRDPDIGELVPPAKILRPLPDCACDLKEDGSDT